MNRRGFLKLLGMAPIAAVGGVLAGGAVAAIRLRPKDIPWFAPRILVSRDELAASQYINSMREQFTKASRGAPAPSWIYYNEPPSDIWSRPVPRRRK
jgi:hypothetical protein